MALKWLRDNLRHLKFVLWGVVVVFVMLVFVDWGSGRGTGAGSDVALKIGRKEVTEQEFVEQVRHIQDLYQRQLGDNWEQFRNQINLGQQAVQQIVERQLLLEEAERVGLVVSEKELRDEILALPVFTNERGEFVGQDMYQRILRSNRTSAQEFEAQLREDLLLQKLQGMVQEGIWIEDGEVEQTIRREGESADAQAVQLRYERFLSEVEVDEVASRAYFETNADDFHRAEERVIRYLVVETNKLRRLLEVESADLEAYYQEHVEDFREGEEVQASHVLIRLAPGASETDKAEAKLKAQQVAELAHGGADFATLAKTHSDDSGSKENGGDLGWFGRDRMVKEFENAVFGAKPGEIVGPVESQFGFHVIKLVGYRPDRTPPLDEIEEDIRFRYLESQAAAEAELRAGALAQRLTAERLDDDAGWQAVADEDEAVTLNESPAFEAGGPVPGAGSDPAFADEVFASEQGAIGGPQPTPRGWIVWQLKEIRPEGVPLFEEARAEVEQQLRKDGAIEIARLRGDAVAEAWRAGGDITSLAEENDTTVVEVKDHRRGSAWASLGVLSSLDEIVYQGSTGDVVGPVVIKDRGVVVVGIDTLKLVDDTQLETQREQVRRRLMAERAGRLMTAIVNERRRETTVTVNNELLARFAPQG